MRAPRLPSRAQPAHEGSPERSGRLVMRWAREASRERGNGRVRLVARWVPILAVLSLLVTSGSAFAAIPMVVPLREAIRPGRAMLIDPPSLPPLNRVGLG